MNKCIVAIVLCLVIFSCDESRDDSFCERYDEGKIIIEMYQDASIDRSFHRINNYGLYVQMVAGHYYESGLPGDSIHYIVEHLNSKDYINSHGFSAVQGTSVYLHPQTRALTLFCNLWDMTIARQQDWLETMTILRLTEIPSPKIFVLLVPVGREKEFVKTFEGLDEVRYANLNCMVGING